jgi:hypothetical protein
MTRLVKNALVGAVVAMVAVAGGPRAIAQESQRKAITPTRVDVVITRLQGDKKVASLPFTLFVSADSDFGGTSVRMGVDVPVGATTVTTGRETPVGSRGSTTTSETSSKVEYRHVGTSIDCQAARTDDGRFQVNVQIQDSSVFTADVEGRAALKAADPMAFRTFSMQNRLILREGVPQQFTMATDKISGETLRVDVTLTVLK